MGYDKAGSLAADRKGYSYQYDYEIRLVKTTVRYCNNHWQVVEEYDSGGTVNYAGAVVERYEAACPDMSLVGNAYGEPNILDGSYTPRSPQASTCDNSYMFTGRQVDILDGGALKIQYNRNRYYDYYTGRWTTQDPLGYVDAMNLYLYTKGGPADWLDPYGFRAAIRPNPIRWSPGGVGFPGPMYPLDIGVAPISCWEQCLTEGLLGPLAIGREVAIDVAFRWVRRLAPATAGAIGAAVSTASIPVHVVTVLNECLFECSTWDPSPRELAWAFNSSTEVCSEIRVWRTCGCCGENWARSCFEVTPTHRRWLVIGEADPRRAWWFGEDEYYHEITQYADITFKTFTCIYGHMLISESPVGYDQPVQRFRTRFKWRLR